MQASTNVQERLAATAAAIDRVAARATATSDAVRIRTARRIDWLRGREAEVRGRLRTGLVDGLDTELDDIDTQVAIAAAVIDVELAGAPNCHPPASPPPPQQPERNTPMETTKSRIEHTMSRFSHGLLYRGLLAVALGIVLLVWPGPSIGVMVFSLGAFAMADGVVALTTAMAAPKGDRGWLALHGVAGVATGLAVWLWPGITALALLYVIGLWAIVIGTAELAATFTAPAATRDRVALAVHGVIAIAVGILTLVRPGAGAVALVTYIGLLAIALGMLFIGGSLSVRRSRKVGHQFPGSEQIKAAA